jgi:mannan endo-1,4-beta-mannosidase
MRFLPTALVTAGAFWQVAQAASSFSASNLYYAAGLTAAEQKTLFTGLKEANIKVLRVWLDGKIALHSRQSSAFSLTKTSSGESSGQKGTTFTSYGALEASSAGKWDDTVLNNLDDVMNTAHSYGIKLLISMHSYNALSGKADYYGNKYTTSNFYTDSTAMSQFKNRINHVLDHVNPHNNKRWGDSSEYIFAFEAQNEPMHDQVS